MQQGDLVHIPQDVNMWNSTDNGTTIIKTHKPITGIFLREELDTYQGRENTVAKRQVYPMGEQHGTR